MRRRRQPPSSRLGGSRLSASASSVTRTEDVLDAKRIEPPRAPIEMSPLEPAASWRWY
jgi:hypothetical protein